MMTNRLVNTGENGGSSSRPSKVVESLEELVRSDEAFFQADSARREIKVSLDQTCRLH